MSQSSTDGCGLLRSKALAGFDLIREVVALDPTQDCGLEAAETEIKCVAFHARNGESNAARIAERGQLIDHRTARISEGRAVWRPCRTLHQPRRRAFFPEVYKRPLPGLRTDCVCPPLTIKARAGNSTGICVLLRFKNYSVNVPFDMVLLRSAECRWQRQWPLRR